MSRVEVALPVLRVRREAPEAGVLERRAGVLVDDEVDERRIADVKEGQRGIAVLSALPNEQFDFVVEKITPISIAKEGMNYFRVEAVPATVSERFRPGMEGVGKIFVDRRNIFLIWTRDFREWIKIRMWQWWP